MFPAEVGWFLALRIHFRLEKIVRTHMISAEVELRHNEDHFLLSLCADMLDQTHYKTMTTTIFDLLFSPYRR